MGNIVWHDHRVTKAERRKLNNHSSCVVWFTGLPSSGKSTIASEVEYQLCTRGLRTYLLDGDNVRHGLNKNLGFSPEDREENIRRIGEVARLFVDAGMITFVAFISPYRKDRQKARKLLEDDEFIEVYVKCPVAICEQRDPKGLYQKAKKGEIKEFTGVSAPYEEPLDPEIVLETDRFSVVESVNKIIRHLEDKGLISSVETDFKII
jgi:adenylylsulfate kinase